MKTPILLLAALLSLSASAQTTVTIPGQTVPISVPILSQPITVPQDPAIPALGARVTALEAAVKALQAAPVPTPPASAPETDPPPVVVPPVSKIAAADIFAEIDANKPFAQEIGGAGLECDGPNRGAIKGISDANGLTGTTPDGKRFGKTPDPLNPAKTVLLFAPNKNDALTAAAPRCEASWWHSQPGKLKTGTDIWYAFGMLVPEGSYGWESVVSQWHQECCVNPWAAFALRKGSIDVQLRWNSSPNPTQAGNSTRSWNSPGVPIDKWTVFVVKAKISPLVGGGGYYKVWRDGAVVADYTGPISYNTGDARVPWAKFGVYPWGYASDGNRWTTPETMKVLFKAPVFVHDPAGKYTEADLRAYVLAR